MYIYIYYTRSPRVNPIDTYVCVCVCRVCVCVCVCVCVYISIYLYIYMSKAPYHASTPSSKVPFPNQPLSNYQQTPPWHPEA